MGRQLQLHLQPPERQPVGREQLLHEQSRHPEQLRGHSGIGVLQPGAGVRTQPARLASQDRDRADRHAAVRRGRSSDQQPDQQRASRRLVDHAGRHDPERLPDGRHAAADHVNGLSFLFGGAAAERSPGQDILTAGDITDRITASTSDGVYFSRRRSRRRR